MALDAAYWIRALGLVPHPEGGHYRETWRSRLRTDRGRALGSAIYFLLEGKEFSAFHRIAADEIWHFYDGDPITITMIAPNGSISRARLGRDPEKGDSSQIVVPAGTWFAAAIEGGCGYALAGCTTAPGFDYADWELADRGVLSSAFPQHRAEIEGLTRPGR